MRSNHPNRRWRRVGLLLMWLVTLGCGGSTLERLAVRGAVLLDGEPLPAGTVHFLPTGGTSSPPTMAVVSEGFYELPRGQGPVSGEYRVEIQVQDALPFDLDDDLAYAEAQAASSKPLDLGFRTTRFKDPAASNVRLEGETSALDFELETVSRTRKR
jgi:hypothetical protein